MWTLDEAEQVAVFFALLRLSVGTHLRVVAGERAGIRQSEETITETTLLELSIALPTLRISTHTHQHESRSGADWEWWIEGDTTWFGMVVQAKRLHAMNARASGYGFGYAPDSADGGLQVDRLIHTAESRSERRIAPVYVLFNGTDELTSRVDCPFQVVDRVLHAGGITAMSAYTVRALAEKNVSSRGRYKDVPLDQASPCAIPWSCLATCGTACGSGYDPDTPQSWADADFGEHDPARRAAAAIDVLIFHARRAGSNPNDIRVESPMHDRPPSYVPITVDGWIDGEFPGSPIASHLGVLYRNRSDSDQ